MSSNRPPTPSAEPVTRPPAERFSGSHRVAAGIFASRLSGLARESALAQVFGLGPVMDVFRAALKAPNLLQNLLGEGTLSASFIPVYSRFLARGETEKGRRFASTALCLLAVVTAILVVLGIVFARPLVTVLSPGFVADAAQVAAGDADVDRFEHLVSAVRWIFPMTGMLVIAVWALGVLNSHRRFFLSYVAPVLWNASLVAALLIGVRWVPPGSVTLLYVACGGVLVGGFLQLAVQLPVALKQVGGFRPSLSLATPGVRQALGTFAPIVAGRGALQLGSYLDLVLAGLLARGAVGALFSAQYFYMLPISLFGMSVAAAELPELSRADGAASTSDIRRRVELGLGRVSFLTLPTMIGYLAFGFLLIGAVLRGGRFGVLDNWLVYLVLAGYSLGLVAGTWSRLLQSSFFALGDTKTPARISAVRVFASALVGAPLMLWLDRIALGGLVGVSPDADSALQVGAVGLALGSAVGAWLELARLVGRLRGELGGLGLPWRAVGKMALIALASAAAAAAVWRFLPIGSLLLTAVIVVGLYAALYLGIAYRLGVPEAASWLGALFGSSGR